jgi:ABC-type transporter Mla MlaB component
VITETRTHTIEPDITVFEISGRLNLGNLLMSVENAVRGLIDAGTRKLVIDLAGLNAIDSAGIGMLVGCNGHMDKPCGRAGRRREGVRDGSHGPHRALGCGPGVGQRPPFGRRRGGVDRACHTVTVHLSGTNSPFRNRHIVDPGGTSGKSFLST